MFLAITLFTLACLPGVVWGLERCIVQGFSAYVRVYVPRPQSMQNDDGDDDDDYDDRLDSFYSC